MRHRSPALLIAGLLVLLTLPAAGRAEKWAVLVGVNEYEFSDPTTLPPLKCAENDATEMARILEANGYKIRILTTDLGREKPACKPTKENIDAVLKDLLGTYDDAKKRTVGATVKRGDTILIGLSGHGLKFEGDKQNYFCPCDAKPKATETGTLVSIESILEKLQVNDASNRFLLVDACRNELGAKAAADDLNVDKGIGVLLSCTAGQKSFEDSEEFRHGLFFHYVIESLKGNGESTGKDGVTWEDMSKTVRNQVPAAARAKNKPPQQPIDLSRGFTISPVLTVPSEPDSLTMPFDANRAATLQKKWASHIRKNDSETIELASSGADPVSLQLQLIPPGRFERGSSSKEAGRETDEGQHPVVISRPYFIGRKEITQRQFALFFPDHVNDHSSKGDFADKVKGGDTREFPADKISRDAALKYCEKVTKVLSQSGRWQDYECRLPTEAEWEFACRGGSTEAFAFGSELTPRQANFDLAKVERPEKTGSFAANGFGLLDMHGNVAEWCQDYHAPYPGKEVKDPKGPAVGREFVLRGGHYNASIEDCRSAARRRFDKLDDPTPICGFRVVIAPIR